MSDSEDDWFEKDIDEFVVKTKIEENVENISSAQPNVSNPNAVDEMLGPDYGGNYQLPEPKKSVANTNKNQAYVHPMSFQKMAFLYEEETAIATFLEITHPGSGFVECLSRKTNAIDTIVALSNVIRKVFTVPFAENIRSFAGRIVAEENFWSQCDKYLKESTTTSKKPKAKAKKGQPLPKDDKEIWQCVVQLCESLSDHKIRLKQSFVKKAIAHAEDNQNPALAVQPWLERLKSVQEKQEKLKAHVDSGSIFPTLDELKSANEAPLNPNIVKGKYRDVAHYLDVHLSLLREDFLSPLRDGVQEIVSKFGVDEEARSNLNVKVYSGVRIEVIQKELPNKPGVMTDCIVVDLEAKARDEGSPIGKYAHSKFSKRLMYGSLLCLSTSNQFEDLVVAVVTYRDNELLEQGYIQIEIVQIYNITSLFNRDFIMCESDVYFETYRHVYEVLRNSNEHSFPLKNYIVDVEVTPTYPSYIPEDGKTVFIYKNHPLEMKDPSKWPSAQTLRLNDSQLNAFKSSLTRKFSVVQGPPGCGKTFIGLEIVSTLIQNTDAQILVVCYTNHALDQFLTGILKCTSDIVRIGNQSKNELLDQFNLRQLNDSIINDKTLRGCLYALRCEYAAAIQEFSDLQVKMKASPNEDALLQEYMAIQAKLQSISKRQEELKQIGHYHLIKSKRVIGMTSTGAARCHSLIQLLQTPIVFIEEAAEILEPHIVASLTPSVQHLIMIGDHQQLRPTSSVYKLAKLYKMDISLFERMLNNDMVCATLNEQYRMRPEIANLIRPTIYKTLNDNAVVQNYPPVTGVEKSLFFLSHEHPESADGDETTKKNDFEVKYLIALCKYLILQGYSAEHITILTTYNGQLMQLFNEKKHHMQLRRVRVTVVDNFQGEDNKIILLSLVRSNTNNNIGYLAFKNRVCVALSRAKEGLFVVGNMNLLAANSKTWREIQAELTTQGAIGDEMHLVCSTHQNVTKVQKAADFKDLEYGGCHSYCDVALACGHHCRSVCHAKTMKHECEC